MMTPGSVIIDISIDQGGCVETSHPTTHSSPVYVVDGIIHYCVANMPGAYPWSSTFALTNATLPFGLAIADHGWKHAARNNGPIAKGINLAEGSVTYRPVADAHGLVHRPIDEIISHSPGRRYSSMRDLYKILHRQDRASSNTGII